MNFRPVHIDLDRTDGLTLTWPDASTDTLPVALLRRMSPSAEQRNLREEMSRNPLAVLPANTTGGPLTATNAELVGNYAIRIEFSDGHSTGIFTWSYLRELAVAHRAEASQ